MTSESRVVPCGRKDGQRDRHDEAKMALLNFANAPKNRCSVNPYPANVEKMVSS